MFRILAILIVGLLAVYINGCGTDEGEIEEGIPVNFVSVTPPGGEIAANSFITLTFDNEPTGVTSTAGNITVTGKTVVVNGPFNPGDLDFTVTWIGGSKALKFHVAGLGLRGHKSLDAIEVDNVQPQPGVTVNFLRSDPIKGFSIIDVDTVILYFDNRPTDVKITEASEEITKAIVKGNTVEIFIKQPVFVPDIHFTVTWTGGKVLLYYLNEPDDTVADFRRSAPADGSSIVGVEKIRVSLSTHPKDVKCYNHTSESFIEDVTVLHNTIEFLVPHPIKEPSISFTVSWTSRDKTAQNSIKLTYTNEDVAPEE